MNESKPVWHQLLVPVILLIVFVLAVWGVILLQKNFQKQPSLEVSIPETSNTTEKDINITGKTTIGANVTVNGKKTSVDKNGNFSYLLPLKPGENKVIFEAKKDSSVSTTAEKTVIRETIPVKPVNKTEGLTSSGPTENIGIFGLSGIILSLIYYFKSRNKNIFTTSRYKLFTEKTI